MKQSLRIFVLAVITASLVLAAAYLLMDVPLASLAVIGMGTAWATPIWRSVRKIGRDSTDYSANIWLAGYSVAALLSAMQGGVFFWLGLAAMLCALAAWDLQAFIHITSIKYVMELLPPSDQPSANARLERDHLRLLGIVLAAGGGLAMISVLVKMLIQLNASLPVVLGFGVVLVALVVWLGRILLSQSS